MGYALLESVTCCICHKPEVRGKAMYHYIDPNKGKLVQAHDKCATRENRIEAGLDPDEKAVKKVATN